MRMWMVDPKMLCRQHLLGEHRELHMLVGTILKNVSLQGYLENGLVEPQRIEERHEQLVKEMKRRGYNHNSELREFEYKGKKGVVDINKSILDLHSRCAECKVGEKE